jgi:hypothetical protein
MLVCKSRRCLALDYLYEEVHVGEHAKSLLESLEKSEILFPGKGSGRRVRCVILSAWRPEIIPVSLLDVFQWCPNVKILVKSDDDIALTPTSGVDLSSIKRFDWIH